jgi:secreted trypsin-like serine protease
LCTIPGENTTCDGDNGGPMICNGLLYGICSFAINYKGDIENICGSENLQTVHVFLHYYRKWIHNIIRSDTPYTQYTPTTVSISDTTVITDITDTTDSTDTTDLPETTETPKTTTKKPKKKNKNNSGKSITSYQNILYTISALVFYYVLSFN